VADLFTYTLLGIFSGAAYAIVASGLVLTYTTTRVFNVAHGAFGMLLSYVFWDFSVRQGLNLWLSLGLVLFVVAPAIGWLISRFIARGLGDAPVSVSLVVTVALLVMCVGVARQVYPPEARSVLPFMNDTKSVEIGDTFISAHQIITVLLSALVAVLLYLLLNRTRIGTAMRASVDNPELLKLFGGKPEQVAALAWAIGISLAALGGILLVSVVGLDYFSLTLLVINAYAAAVLGGLKSLPLTFAGAMALGIAQSFAVIYLPTEGFASGIRGVVPSLFLFVIIVALPTTQLRVGQVKGIVAAPLPSTTKALSWGGGLLVFVALMTVSLSETNLLLAGTAATYAMVMLSLVLLTGYGGHVSLAQFTFAGVGALAYIKIDQPNLAGLFWAALVTGIVGAVVALSVLRLTGVYLALATLAFGDIMSKLVFKNADFAFGYNGTLPAERLSVLGLKVDSTGGYVFLMAVFLVLMSWGLLALRRGVLGRMTIALRDSPAGCGTLGLDARGFRVGLFGLSAAMAGVAGALFAGLRESVGSSDFEFFQSLLLLLFAVVFGVTSVTGAVLGGVGFMLLPVLQSDYPDAAGMFFVVLAVGAILLARNPNGLSIYGFRLGRLAEHQLGRRLRPKTAAPLELVEEERVDVSS
jgi:branched-chain amino acid transport system permease protein